ncbi:hypothetical protein LOTGIDRAFT_184154 [Lottia gigantea]|uniref:F-box/LRR-repeat protein 15-like leucin rich repeat domain-containing protein n=1 Tax=Lottia gigantea TaxID=225164 RepID=V3ZIQ0_LOTGI|nr:hypothetical protein LOTGIDRAFT_184154 [Lottia gigantea]ESO84107.1 hypothetical protein LOTGIDRAFT_184154 [Lottia gigantea]
MTFEMAYNDSVATLFTISSRAVVHDLDKHGNGIKNMSSHIKDECLKLMSRRGLLTDNNIELIIHNRIRKIEMNLCENISDEGLFKLGKCPNLVKIDINAPNPEIRCGITSQGIMNLARSCPYLQIVFLRKCSNVTDDGVIALAENCPRLRHLNLRGCTQLTDKSVIAIGEHLSFISSLNISMTQVTDDGIFKLVSGNCNQTIKELDISNCIALTDEAVEAVTQSCSLVSILIFHGCPKMTEQARLALEDKEGPQMKHVTWTIY